MCATTTNELGAGTWISAMLLVNYIRRALSIWSWAIVWWWMSADASGMPCIDKRHYWICSEGISWRTLSNQKWKINSHQPKKSKEEEEEKDNDYWRRERWAGALLLIINPTLCVTRDINVFVCLSSFFSSIFLFLPRGWWVGMLLDATVAHTAQDGQGQEQQQEAQALGRQLFRQFQQFHPTGEWPLFKFYYIPYLSSRPSNHSQRKKNQKKEARLIFSLIQGGCAKIKYK